MTDPLLALTAALSDRYRLERELGRGGMATVWLAEDVRHHRRVAVKVLHPELAAVLGAERFLAEIRTTANLQHPNILPLFDSGEAAGQLYYVMPFVEGETLRSRLARETHLPVDDALRMAVEVAGALDCAHRHARPGVRPTRPGNGPVERPSPRVMRRQALNAGVVLGLLLAPVNAPIAQQARTPAADAVYEASITQLQDGLRSGRWTSAQLVDAYLARIRAYDQQGPALNAIIRLNPAARREAADRDRERRAGGSRGMLHGIPVLLKDNYDTRDMPTSAGSLAYAGLQPPDDAFVVRRLREAGAIILGKTNMHELAAGITSVSSLGGQTRNAYDPMRCPGGSSGGTGAAIAASFAAIGWGSDTCGSIRIPAAYGNLVGLRPTQGLSSRDGIIPLSHTQDVPGPLARSAADLAIALDATVGHDPADSVTRAVADRRVSNFTDSLSAYPLRGTRLGVLVNYMTGDIDADIRDTVRAALKRLQGAGVETVDIRIADFDSLLANTSVINFETRYDLVDYLRAMPGAPQTTTREILDRGLYHDALGARFTALDTLGTRDSEAYRRALAKQQVLRQRLLALMDSLRVDALVYPTMRRRPVQVGEPQPGGTCAPSAQSGFPALTAPAGFTNDGLPVGIEFLGRPFSDVRLVSLAHGLEQLGSRRRAPSTTPALVRAGAPPPVAVTHVVRDGARRATTHFRFDQPANQLRFDTRVSGLAADRVQAVVLRRRDADGRIRVIHRMLGPAMMVVTATLPLAGADRDALVSGRLSVALFTTDRAPVEVPVTGVRLR